MKEPNVIYNRCKGNVQTYYITDHAINRFIERLENVKGRKPGLYDISKNLDTENKLDLMKLIGYCFLMNLVMIFLKHYCTIHNPSV